MVAMVYEDKKKPEAVIRKGHTELLGLWAVSIVLNTIY
jgi:hypothetical protein